MSIQRRNAEKRDITTRSVSFDGARTFNAETRTVTATISTEAPARVYDWRSGEVVDEVLLASGAKLPASRQVPLLDDHERGGSNSVIGSARNIRTENGELVADLNFSSAEEAKGPMLRVAEGHLTDVSIGYRVLQADKLGPNETKIYGGKSLAGPMRVATSWELLETSTTPIGADRFAKMRSEPDAAKAQGASVTESRQQQENEHMDKLKKLLEARGLKAGASDEEAIRFLESLDETTRTQLTSQADEAKRKAVEDERKRATEIDAICLKHEMPAEFRAAAIKDGKTVEDVRAAVLEKLAEKKSAQVTTGIVITQDARDSFRAAAIGAMNIQNRLVLRNGETHAPGATELAGLHARQFLAECVQRAGEKAPANVGELFKRALAISDFPYIMAGSAYQALQEGFADESQTWRVWAEIGPGLSDFESHTENRASESDDFEKVKEAEEYKFDKRSESAPESYQMSKYGKIMMLTEEMIRGDRLNAFGDIARQHGRAAARLCGDVVYSVLTTNGNMGDGRALFEETYHKNLAATGDHGVVSAKLGLAVAAMMKQKDIAGKQRLNIRPTYLMCPVTMMEAVEQHFGNYQPVTGATTNVFKNMFSPENRVYDARLDDSAVAQWYLAGPKGMTIRVRFLDGQESPALSREDEFERDVIKYKARIGLVAYARDYRALYCNPGS